MTWRKNHLPRVLSSFLLWFIALLITSYTVLFISILVLVIRPNAEMFGDLLISLKEAVGEVANNTDKKHLDKLQTLFAERSEQVQIIEPISAAAYREVWYPGFRYLQHLISSKSHGDLMLRVTDTPVIKLQLIDSNNPNYTLEFTPIASPFVRTFPIVSFFVIFFTCALAAWLISSHLTKPLKNLADQAHRLQSEKDAYAIQFNEEKALPEIASLAQSFNEMRSALDRTIQDRENLLAAVTHDLRTPLSRLQIALDILSANNPTATPPLLEDVGEMRRILDQFVELAKLNDELDEPWFEGDLNHFVGRIRDQYRRAGVNLRTQLPEELVIVKYKAIGLTRLIYNLVDNACRHGDGSVKIELFQTPEGPVLTVSNRMQGNDHGTGLTEALAEQTGRSPTTGLGLRIIRQFAEVHHAELVESIADGIKSFSLHFKA